LHQRTIRFWLTCLVIGCVLPAALGSVFLFTISYQKQRTILERNTTATARALMQAIDAELFGLQSALQVLASSQRLASGDLSGFYRKASEALPNMAATTSWSPTPRSAATQYAQAIWRSAASVAALRQTAAGVRNR